MGTTAAAVRMYAVYVKWNKKFNDVVFRNLHWARTFWKIGAACTPHLISTLAPSHAAAVG